MNNTTGDAKNIVITGFMGTGKSTVGLIVADTIRWKFVDADQEIEDRVGMTIPEIFARDGEQGFRRYETIVCQSLAARSRLVIATGGGMLISEANRNMMMATGFVVCLNASQDTIRQRLIDFEGRPLAPNWETLLEQRREAYAQIPIQIDTTDRTPDEVAQDIVQRWRNL